MGFCQGRLKPRTKEGKGAASVGVAVSHDHRLPNRRQVYLRVSGVVCPLAGSHLRGGGPELVLGVDVPWKSLRTAMPEK